MLTEDTWIVTVKYMVPHNHWSMWYWYRTITVKLVQYVVSHITVKYVVPHNHWSMQHLTITEKYVVLHNHCEVCNWYITITTGEEQGWRCKRPSACLNRYILPWQNQLSLLKQLATGDLVQQSTGAPVITHYLGGSYYCNCHYRRCTILRTELEKQWDTHNKHLIIFMNMSVQVVQSSGTHWTCS